MHYDKGKTPCKSSSTCLCRCQLQTPLSCFPWLLSFKVLNSYIVFKAVSILPCNKFIRFSLSAPVAYKESQCPPFSALPCSPPQQTRHSYWHHQSFSTVHLNLWCSSPNFSVTTKSAHSLIPFKSNYQSTQSASVSRVWIWVCSVKPHHQMHKIWPIN